MTIEQLCQALGAGLLRLVVPPARSRETIVEVVVCGPADEVSGIAAGDLVLAVGAADDETGELMVVRAAEAGAAGIVLKAAGDVGLATRAAADRSAIALLAADPEIAWGRLYELIGSAVGHEPSGELPPGASGGAGNLFALADATALASGAPVTIEDASSQLLAFSREGQEVDQVRVATILGRRVPGKWAERLRRQAELDGVLAGEEPAIIELPGMAPRRVIAIRGAGMLLGSIWLAGVTDDAADDVLREAAAIAALQLLRRRAERDVEHAVRSATVAGLLQTGELSARASAETGLSPTGGFAVAAFELAREGGTPAAHDQLAELVAAHLHAFRRAAAHGVLDGRAYVIAACAGEADRALLLERLRDGVARARGAIGSPLRVGVGVDVETPAGLPRSRAAADRVLALSSARDRVVAFEEVSAAALVADVEELVLAWDGGASAALRLLLAHDREHGTELARTLRAVLEHFGDTASVAAELHVHANTVRYRLRQALELTGLRLTDGTARLALELELRARARDAE